MKPVSGSAFPQPLPGTIDAPARVARIQEGRVHTYSRDRHTR